MTRTYYGDPVSRTTSPNPDPLEDCCQVCGNEVRSGDGCFNCECPASLDPDRRREDRDERRRMEREFPYAEGETTMPNPDTTRHPGACGGCDQPEVCAEQDAVAE